MCNLSPPAQGRSDSTKRPRRTQLQLCALVQDLICITAGDALHAHLERHHFLLTVYGLYIERSALIAEGAFITIQAKPSDWPPPLLPHLRRLVCGPVLCIQSSFCQSATDYQIISPSTVHGFPVGICLCSPFY